MTNKEDHKLDNPVWYALSENHSAFALDYDGTKFYNPDYCPFGSFIVSESTLTAIKQYELLTDSFFIVGEKPEIDDSLTIIKELICLQMVIQDKIQLAIDTEIVKLTENHNAELLQLVNLVQPGYFKTQTPLLGNYYGIFKEAQLIAVAGERMKMNDFTEVSAIITHPDHTGKGYAKQLISHVVNSILDESKTPFLHVVENNIGAISLYEKLGFVTRRKISFWNVSKKQ
ncbi:GNAT family N-acetyltransferase [Flavobacterium tructae]|uniref:GNAT family N-acetyltransferase n=1 Tax=Flavobacterium tructae TaxID=1114873 RepID=A0A1S1JC15_9FLAO|nr:GNAT family N-acetyltransferase [Flavobacterium tructae]OHT45803.1 GNAT family N-acetyltransferase [Flavobacterium tructae]OXB17064.1 GNAT family N-acetyltransferase [Flavobacterium tructae]